MDKDEMLSMVMATRESVQENASSATATLKAMDVDGDGVGKDAL